MHWVARCNKLHCLNVSRVWSEYSCFYAEIQSFPHSDLKPKKLVGGGGEWRNWNFVELHEI